MLRALRGLIIALLVLVVAVVGLVRFAPALFTPAIESAAKRAGYGVSFDDISVSYFPLTASLVNLEVAGREAIEPFVTVAEADVSLALIDFVADEAWLDGEFSGLLVYLDRLPTAAAPAADSTATELDLSPLAQLKRLVFSDVSVVRSAGLAPVLALAGSVGPYTVDASRRGLDFSVAGDVLNLAVDVSGRVEQTAVPRLILTAKRIDLSPVLAAEEEPSADGSDSVASERDRQGPFDLRPLAGASLILDVAEVGDSALSVEALFSLPTLIVELRVDELLGLRRKVPLATEDFLPLQIAIELEGGVDRLSYELTKANWGPNSLAGSGSLDFAPLSVESELLAVALHLPRGQADEGQFEGEGDPPESARVFSAEPIDWSWLSTTSVDVHLSVLELHVLDAVFTDVELTVAGDQGELAIAPLNGSFGNGGFDGSLTLTQQGLGVALSSDFDLDGVDLQAFGFVPEEELTGGALIARIGLTGEGVSVAELAASLDGSILVTVQDAVVQNDTFELIGSDLLMETLNKLNPFAKTDPTTRLDCALVQFDVVEGVMTARSSLVVETEKMEIIGDGTIDLSDETLSIGFSPSSRAGVGVNVGSLVKFLKLGGTLADPRPTADAAGLLKSGVAVGAAMSTGGVSILAEGVFKRLANAGSACERALAGEPILAPEEEASSEDQPSIG